MRNLLKLFGVLLLTVFFVFSCRDDNKSLPKEEKTINDFVWKGLNSWYYWQKDVPNLSDEFGVSSQYLSYINSKKTNDLFYSLLKDYPNTDRFSWIVNDVDILLQELNGISKYTGANLSFYFKDSGKVNVVGIVNYVVPDSPAADAGLERGDVISQINGADLTINNYQQQYEESYSLTIANTVNVTSAGVVTSGEKKKVNLTSEIIQENPIAYYKKFETNSNKKIGYLVYNGFQAIYNDELNAAFAKMKQDGITDLILDLRYNGGGDLETTMALGQMITGNFTDSPYVILDFNDKHNYKDVTGNLSNKVNTYTFVNGQNQKSGEQVANSLGLNKLYVLTSKGTASASELTIKGLRAYINVVTIGAETYGKFVGSTTLFDSPKSDYESFQEKNPSHKWAMQPIVFSYYNGKREENPAKGGITPDYIIDSYSYIGTIKEFGNTSDPALAKALELITGTNVGRMARISNRFSLSDGFLGSTKTMKRFGTELYIQNIKTDLNK